MQPLHRTLGHIQDVVHRDAIGPGGQLASKVKLRQPRDDPGENLPGGILGALPIAEHAEGEAVDAVLKRDLDARNVSLPREGRKVYIYEKLGMKSTYFLRPEAADQARIAGVDAQCRTGSENDLIGFETIAGVGAFRFDSTRSEGSSTVVRDRRWLAPELNCREVRRVVETVLDGSCLPTRPPNSVCR